MTWHLKDRELEKKLIEIDFYFTEKLNSLCDRLDSNKDYDLYSHIPCRITLDWNSKHIIEIVFTGRDVEHVPDYNPHEWNNYPEVTPPEGVLMRVEIDSNGILFRNCAIFSGADWRITSDGSAVYADGYTLDNVKRFRPWED